MNQTVYLAPLRSEDSPTLFEWINDRSLVILSAPYHPVDDQAHHNWFERVTRRSDLQIFAIRASHDDQLVGTCQLHSINAVARSSELQIRLGSTPNRRKGMGTDAVRQLLAFGFRDLNLHRIHLHVLSDNAVAIRTYLKNRFRHEGTLKEAAFIDGEYRDVSMMAILRPEWVVGSACDG